MLTINPSEPNPSLPPQGPPHVVIIGGGFGGLTAAQSLAKKRVRITLIDRTNHHLFQPLLYQVAMAGLSPADIASPIRSVLHGQKNLTVLLDEVKDIDLFARTLRLREDSLAYDFLILSTGARTAYFGHTDWERHAVGLKDLDDAVEIRRRVLLSFEAAEKETDQVRRQRLMTFIVIGGGPTGVELAGALRELSRYVLAQDFRKINPADTRVLLLEGSPRVLASFSPKTSASAMAQLKGLGVEVHTGKAVTSIDETGVTLGDQHIPAGTVLWAAGVAATPLTARLGVPLDRSGRVIVEPDLSLPGHPEAFAIGDTALYLHQTGHPLPGVSPVAMQQARTAVKNILSSLGSAQRSGDKRPRQTFHYFDKGSMATIGRSAAVAEMGRLRLSGYLAWMAWLGVHIFFLIGFRNRFVVLFEWMWSYLTYQRGARLITGHRLSPGAPATAPLSWDGQPSRPPVPLREDRPVSSA